MRKIRILFASLLISLFATKAYSFPEMVRHGYFSCTACHFSPTGGGTLTPYGRVLSSELMTTWGNEKSAEFLHGAVKTPEWLHMGGDVRSLQYYVNNASIEKADFFLMQADLQPVLQFGKWVFSAALGIVKQPRDIDNNKFMSRSYYALYQIRDELSVRLGRFFPAFGLMTPDHIRLTRQGLGFNQGQETQNLEVAYANENFEIIGTAINRRFNQNADVREQGGVLTAALAVGSKSKVGTSFYKTEQESIKRDIAGIWSILHLNEKFYFMNDWAAQSLFQKTSQSKTQNILFFNELGYEWSKGVTPYVIYERSQDVQRIARDMTFENLGLGIHLMPYSHFDFKLEYQNRSDKDPKSTSHTAFLLMHYYL